VLARRGIRTFNAKKAPKQLEHVRIPPNTLAELYPEVGASGAGSWDVF